MATTHYVYDNHTLCYHIEGAALDLEPYIIVYTLASRGSSGRNWKDGGFSAHRDNLRPATLQDFETFRVQPPKNLFV